jgi:threonine dehydratase
LARRHAASTGAVYVSPYNDPWVVAGQGSLGVELAEQVDDLDAVFIALGGGGLLSGVGAYLRSVRPGVEIVACSPENSCVMHQSAQAGRILDLPSLPTLSDGTAGGVEDDSITLDWVCQTVDHYVLVSEEEIRRAMVEIIGGHHQLIEGAAGVAVAAFQKERQRYRGKRVAIVLCGANIALGTLRQVLGVGSRTTTN